MPKDDLDFVEWCDERGITLDDIKHNLNDAQLEILETSYDKYLKRRKRGVSNK